MKRLGSLAVVFCVIAGLFVIPAQAVELQIPAKSAVLMDAATGRILYQSNAEEALAPASVTKIMTMLLIMEAIEDGRIGWRDTVTASEAAAAKGGSQVYLKVGETMSVEDMLKSIAVSSANDCACAMAEHIAGSEAAFVSMMNKRAEELGMKNTHFVNCTGLDDDPEASAHKTSACDIAIMSRQLLVCHPEIKNYTTIWMDTIRDGAFGLSNTNKLVRFYQGATGLKTGYTATAGYCLSASAARDGMELIAVVMGCATSQERFAACKSLLDYGFANYALIAPQLQQAQQIPVKLGTSAYVDVTLGQNEAMLIDKAQKGLVSMQTQLDASVTAPVSKGQRLGTLTVTAGEQILAQVPIVASESVTRLSWGQVFLRVLRLFAMS